MVLHLLGKKSWNVYNQDNIARVRRDEAEAKAREAQQEQRIQEADAEKRIQILRGLRPSTSPPPDSAARGASKERRDDRHRHRKRRKLAGEDDTDRDIRIAREDVEDAEARRGDVFKKPSKEAPLIDEAGHISLFPEESTERNKRAENNAEAEAEAAKKRRDYEDQYTMRFSNAAGYRQKMDAPWYSSSRPELTAQTEGMPSKDVWGNEDPRRREREKQRMDASDPLAAMKKGVRQLRDVEMERKKWNDERKQELESLKKADRESRRHHRRKRRSSGSPDSLEGFSLDADSRDRDLRSQKHRSHRRHRDRSRERSPRSSRKHSERHMIRDSKRHSKSDMERSKRDDNVWWTHAPGKRYSAQFAGL